MHLVELYQQVRIYNNISAFSFQGKYSVVSVLIQLSDYAGILTFNIVLSYTQLSQKREIFSRAGHKNRQVGTKRQFFGEKNFNVFMLPGSLHDLLSIMEGETPLMVVIGTTLKRSSCSY